MKHTRTLFSLSVLAVLLFVSCNSQENKQAKHLLAEVASIVNEEPAQALVLLDSIAPDSAVQTKKLKKKYYAEYLMRRVQAKTKVGADISSDTLILEYQDFFNWRNGEKASLMHYYCGRVYHSLGKSDEAMKAYLKAETRAKNIDNTKLKGLIQEYIGTLYFDQRLYDQSIERYKNAMKYYTLLPDSLHRLCAMYHDIAWAFDSRCGDMQNSAIKMMCLDSASIYYSFALEKAIQEKNTDAQAIIYNNLSIVAQEQKEFFKSKKYLTAALPIVRDSFYLALIHLNLAYTYYYLNQIDSIREHVQIPLNYLKPDKSLKQLATGYWLFSLYEAKKGRTENAINYLEKYSDAALEILRKNKQQNVLDIQKRYDFELIQKEKERERVHKLTSIIIGLILLCGAITALLIFYKKHLQTKLLLEKGKMLMLEAEIQIKDLQAHTNILNKQEGELKSELDELLHLLEDQKIATKDEKAKSFVFYKKILSLEHYLSLNRKSLPVDSLIAKMNEFFYGQGKRNWDALYFAMNAHYDNLFDRFRMQNQTFNDTEFKILCLDYLNFTNEEIGHILNYSASNIKRYKLNLRKKLNLTSGQNFKFLFDTFSEKNFK